MSTFLIESVGFKFAEDALKELLPEGETQESFLKEVLPEGETQESFLTEVVSNVAIGTGGAVGYVLANSGPLRAFESIVGAANEHCAQLVRLKRHVVNARIKAKCAR